jgi:hypothetical protein
VTIAIRLILYISYIALIVSPPQPPPLSLKAIARGFFVLFHMIYEVHLTYTVALISIHTSPSSIPSHTHCTCFIVRFFIINI